MVVVDMLARMFNGLVYTAGFLIGYILVSTFVGRIDGYYWPVVNQVSFTSIEPVGDTRSRIRGEFFKVRGTCDFDDVQFFLGTPWAGTRVDRTFEEGSKKRDGGREEFGPWLIQLDEEQFKGRSYAIAYHRCSPFWITKTIFYRS